MQPLLVAKNIKKRFTDPHEIEILKDINLELYPQKSVAVIGRSGEGKTTLLHILGTIDTPTSGSLQIAGNLVTPGLQDRLRNKHIGFIFQAFHLLTDMTALENVLMPLKIARRQTGPNTPSYNRALFLLEMCGLGDRIHFPVSKLSGGEKQRVAIARALVHKPNLIVADEPTGNLDPKTGQEIIKLLMKINEDGTTIILTTHNKDLVNLINKRVVVLEAGKVVSDKAVSGYN